MPDGYCFGHVSTGDSFRGGLIYGMLRGWSDEDTVRFAVAVAALICTTGPRRVNPPTLEQVTDFLALRGVTSHPALRT